MALIAKQVGELLTEPGQDGPSDMVRRFVDLLDPSDLEWMEQQVSNETSIEDVVQSEYEEFKMMVGGASI